MSWLSPSLAGFQVATYGRFWVATEEDGPRSVSWFVSVVQNHWADKERRALPPVAAGTGQSELDDDEIPF